MSKSGKNRVEATAPKGTAARRNQSPHANRYPWEQWFKDVPTRLVRGTHFLGTVHGFAVTARMAAKSRGLYLKLWVGTDSVTIVDVFDTPSKRGRPSTKANGTAAGASASASSETATATKSNGAVKATAATGSSTSSQENAGGRRGKTTRTRKAQ